MASKKYSFLTGILCLLASYGFSQTTTTGTGYDVMDSSVVPSRRMPQYSGFKQGVENYPAKPRNMWEIGVKVGTFNVSGDIATVLSPGFGVHVRKAFGYVFSARLEYMYGIGKGQAWLRSLNYTNDPAWKGVGYRPNIDPVYYNYKNNVQDLALEGIFSLNNIRFHKSKTGVNFYALAGIGFTVYETKINALGSDGNRYNFASIPQGTWKTRKDTKDAIKNLSNHDDTYETLAETHGDRRPKLFGKTFKPVGHLGGGVAFKLSNKLNLAIEERFTVTNDDLLDGQQWAEQTPTAPVLTQNFDAYNYTTIGLNINLGSKSVEPLWWLNPLDYAYQEIRKPKYMILPKPVLPDADGDGVTDQFDQEQTPQGCPVDTHGVSLDTDGDGVPDCRDKEKVTPTYCQPVDADGVGKCPCPDTSCYAGMMPRQDECSTALGALPSITFTSNTSVTLTNDAKGLLASIAARLRQNPNCRIVVTSYCSSTKAEQQRSWDRVNVVINQLVDKEGISQDRFYWQIGQEGGDCNTVDFRAATDADAGLPTTVPAPHPNLSRGK
jgi:outer membrane protein OmpA-like peptidoglycan-associated protein